MIPGFRFISQSRVGPSTTAAALTIATTGPSPAALMKIQAIGGDIWYGQDSVNALTTANGFKLPQNIAAMICGDLGDFRYISDTTLATLQVSLFG